MLEYASVRFYVESLCGVRFSVCLDNLWHKSVSENMWLDVIGRVMHSVST